MGSNCFHQLSPIATLPFPQTSSTYYTSSIRKTTANSNLFLVETEHRNECPWVKCQECVPITSGLINEQNQIIQSKQQV